MRSPGGPVAGLVADATAKTKVAAGPSTICPPPKVTAPVTIRVALANGMPAKPGVEANARAQQGRLHPERAARERDVLAAVGA